MRDKFEGLLYNSRNSSMHSSNRIRRLENADYLSALPVTLFGHTAVRNDFVRLINASQRLYDDDKAELGADDHEICMRGMRSVRNLQKYRQKTEYQEKFSQRVNPFHIVRHLSEGIKAW